ncbi:hypothetical protein V1478_003459 [Vespula squamosa]|uniref:Uncharacterized protein n=1 Tax=Vespula squamosa TaxID=30214 RepID=A0ABD2BLX7_VESSQ
MDVKSIIFFLLLLCTIFNRSLAIEIFSDDDKFIRSKELIKNDPNEISSISSEHIDEPDHKIPYSEHENSKKDVPTKPKYLAPGDWAKPSKEKNISIDFVPTKIYAQVRETHTVKRAPREEAIEEADTDEEKLNALRLREVVKNSKVNTVYTEEGYEDSAYDHAGHIRDADFHEDFNRNLRNRLKEKHGEERTISDELTNREDNHNERDENDEENSRENYLESNLNPKSIVRNEIEVLEEDLERESEEAEDNSDIRLFDSKKLKKSRANNEISSNENYNQDRKDEKENENIYNKNPTDRITYVTTAYNNPERTIVDRSKENLSTSDYGKIVWDFLKTTTNDPLNEQEITLTQRKEATTLSPDLQSPMLITTIPLTLPGSYFVPTIKETVTLPSVYPASQNFLPRGLSSETVNAGVITSIAQNNDQIWPRRTNDDPTIRSVVSDSSNSSWKPLTHSTIDQSSLNDFDDIVSSNGSIESPTTISPDENQTENFQSEDVKIDDNNENYFSNPFVDRKKIKYKVLGRYKPRKSTKSTTSSRSRKENDLKDLPDDVKKYNKNVNDQRAKYAKVLNYVMNQDRSKESNDFTNARGPNEVKYFDFRVEDRPTAGSELAIVDQSSVPIESETIMREPNDKNFPWNRPISSVDSFLGTSSLPIYKIDTFSLLGLSPPPLPLPTQLLPPSKYRNKYRSLSFPYNNEGGYYRNIEPILKYAPVIVDLKRKSRTRRKRTAEYVKGEVNNGTTNRDEINQDNENIFRVTKDGRKSRVTEGSRNNDHYEERTRQRTISKSLDKKKPHEELLNESPKITTLVVEKEIGERFNEDNEKSDNEKLENQRKSDEVSVKVEVPTNYDYEIEELANQEIEKLPVVEETTKIDLKKYPFYKNERVSDLSGLKYALHPGKIPRKTSTGMEFYDSRDTYKNCEEVDADLDELPPKEERPSNDRDPSVHEPRLRGLGEKLDCFKAKYFDENPFDNPLFMEKNVGDPNLPKELDPKKLSRRVLVLPIGTSKEYIPEKLSRKPERDSYHPYVARNSKVERRVPKNQTKKERISASLELSPAPYHRQVYEDVMNNIKESADIYRNHRMTTISPTTLTESISTDIMNVKTFDNISSTNKTNLSDIEKDSNTTRIDGLLPPKGPNDFGKIIGPRRNRIARKSRRRPSLYHVPRTVRRYHKITIQKRSIEKQIGDSKLVEKNAKENIKNVRPRKRKFSVLSKNLTSSADDLKKDSSSRIIYTIRDRIKHSKPKDELKDVGKFTKESRTLDEDSRRKEPRYNSVERKRNSFDSSTVPTILSTIWSNNTDIEESTTTSTISNKRLRYSTLLRDKTRKNSEEHPNEKESITKDQNKYEVRENTDDIETTPIAILSTTSLEYSDYPTSDPPKYNGAFTEETTDSPMFEESRSKVSNDDLEEDFKSDEHSHESEEDSSSEKEEEDEEDEGTLETKERDVSKEEDKTFFSHYSSRPYSPSENYEDEKYSELGARINKPAFYHPPFSMEGYERSSISPFEENSEEMASDEKKKRTRYTSFPWSSEDEGRNKNSFEESKYTPFWSYEFPWEKRERLARERRRERKNYGRFDDFSSRDSNEDVSSSKATHTRFYPWDLYDVPPSKRQRSNRQGRYFDTEESSSLHKPIKYSSKYNSNNLKSSQSIENNFNNIQVDSDKLKRKKNQKGSSNDRRIITGTLVPEDITLAPRKEIGRRKTAEKNNLTEVNSVPTIKYKNRKNTTKKEVLKETLIESTTLRIPINAEATIKSNRVIDRPIDKSRRRRILKNNFKTDDDVKGYSTQPVKEQVKRRKIRSTTITPTTIRTTTMTTTFTSTKKSTIRRRPQTRYQLTNNQFSKIEDTFPTPSTTTVEHRSRVSKESFIRTTYPDNENLTTNVNDDPATLDIKRYNKNNEIDRNRGNITSENVERILMTTKETPDHVYRTKKIDKDGVKEMFISIEPNKAKNITELDDSDISEFGKEDNKWEISQDLDLSGIPSTEVSSFNQDGVVRLIEHSLSNIRSTVSWISENYDY